MLVVEYLNQNRSGAEDADLIKLMLALIFQGTSFYRAR